MYFNFFFAWYISYKSITTISPNWVARVAALMAVTQMAEVACLACLAWLIWAGLA
jgi:hypothetical protein